MAAKSCIGLSVIIFSVYGGLETSASPYCPEGGVISNDPDLYPCLIISTDQLGWHDALDFCEMEGGTLVKIENQKQQDYIKSHQSIKNYHWFGMNDLDEETKYVWTDGKPVTWFNWEDGQPNGGDTQNCTSISKKYEWQDKECENLYYYVCEITANSQPVENVVSSSSPALRDQAAKLQKPDSPADIQLMSRLKVEDQILCVLYCLYDPNCKTVAYGPAKSPYNCLLYKPFPGGYAPLWRGWYTYTVVG